MEYRPITLSGQGHVDIIREAVNATEENNNWRVLEDGRTLCLSEWQDEDDLRIYLTAIRGIDPRSKQKSDDMEKPWIYYFLKRESSMPGFEDQKFHFTSRAHEDKVWLCDEEGKAITKQSHEQNMEYMNIAFRALYMRPARQDTDASIRLFALENIMSSDKVKKLVARLDDGTRNSIGIDLILNYIIQQEPILTSDRGLIESYIKDMHMWRMTDDPTPEAV